MGPPLITFPLSRSLYVAFHNPVKLHFTASYRDLHQRSLLATTYMCIYQERWPNEEEETEQMLWEDWQKERKEEMSRVKIGGENKNKQEIDETWIKLRIGVWVRGEEEGNHRVMDEEGLKREEDY